MHDRPRRRWLQFSLRGLMVGMLLVGVSLGLFARWWFTPAVEREYHKNGAVSAESWRQRDWRGRWRSIEESMYYSNGQKAVEDKLGNRRHWLPDGKAAHWTESERMWWADNGDGTFRKLIKQP